MFFFGFMNYVQLDIYLSKQVKKIIFFLMMKDLFQNHFCFFTNLKPNIKKKEF